MVRYLVKEGHEVCVIMSENSTQYIELPDAKVHPVYFMGEEKIEGQLDFNFLGWDPHPRSNMTFDGATDEQLKQYENAFRKAIEEEIEVFKPDIIHAQHMWIISSIVVDYELPVVVTSHGEVIFYKKGTKWDKYTDKVTAKSKKIIAISQNNHELIHKCYDCPEEKIITLLNGYNEEMFYKDDISKEEFLQSFDIENKYEKIVCFAGRLAKNKGIDILLKSAKIYEENNILTLIAGDGGEYKSLYKLKEELELKNIVFLGHLDQDNLRKLYSISDVSAVPSRQEAFGLVALEAIACGTPAVGTNSSGMAEFITPECGILVEKENVKELANELKNVLNGEKKFSETYLKDYAKNGYSQGLYIKKVLKIYKEAIN
jgi:glycosyltransferase involved in cell wall biosynthesis